MNKYLLLLLFLCTKGTTVFAQKECNLHIVTASENHLPGFPNFHFEVNGQPYKIKAGQCLDLRLGADSIHIIVEDKRWGKKETDNLHIAAAEDVYVMVRVQWTGNYKNPKYGAQVLCLSCYEDLKRKCKKEVSE